jgi:hypothetical protein
MIDIEKELNDSFDNCIKRIIHAPDGMSPRDWEVIYEFTKQASRERRRINRNNKIDKILKNGN